MVVLGVNSILKWCQILSNGRKYTCPTKKINGELFFHFKKQWHRVSEFTSDYTDELFEKDGKILSRKYN